MLLIYLIIIIVSIPYLLFLFLKPNINLTFIIILAFITGLLELIGLPSILVSLTLEGCIVLLFLSILITKNGAKFRHPGLTTFIIYTGIVIFSALINLSSIY